MKTQRWGGFRPLCDSARPRVLGFIKLSRFPSWARSNPLIKSNKMGLADVIIMYFFIESASNGYFVLEW